MSWRAAVVAAVAAAFLIAILAGCGAAPAPARIEVVYFYRTIRCPSCIQLENWAKSAVSNDVAAGRVTWLTLNLDEPPNKQFEDRYGLVAQSVVLREFRGDKETQWKNLDKVWDLLDDEAVFRKYILDELQKFIAKTEAAS